MLRTPVLPSVCLLIAAWCMTAPAQEPPAANAIPLSGNLPPELVAQSQPYLVTTDIYVPSGKTVRIEPGAVLLFRNFTGLHVEGRLIAAGERGRPVVFTSENDRSYNPSAPLLPNAYDWNGIFIHEGGLGTELTSCAVGYSVYGINALTRFVRLQDVAFHDNGRADLTIEGKLMEVRPGVPFSYAASLDDARKAGVPVQVLTDPLGKRRNGLRYGGLGVFFVGCAFAAWCGNAWSADLNRLAALKDLDVEGENSNLVKNRRADFDAAVASRNRAEALTFVGGGIALLGTVGFTWSFSF